MSDLDLAFDGGGSVTDEHRAEVNPEPENNTEVEAGESRNGSENLEGGEAVSDDNAGASESSQQENADLPVTPEKENVNDSGDAGAEDQAAVDWEKQAKAFKAKALDEKNKRQALEESQKENANKPPMPDALDDPEGFAARIKSDVQKEALNARANISEKYARKTISDFDEKWPLVEAYLKATPSATKDVLSSDDPYGTAFEIFEQAQQIEKFKDPKFLENERAKIRAEIMAELKQEPPSKTQNLTPSLARQNGAGASSNPPPVSTSLDDIFTN